MNNNHDEEDINEAFWFVKWCQVRAQLKKAKAALADIQDSEVYILRNENLQLKNTLTQIREQYQVPYKEVRRTYKGNNPNKIKP